MLQLTDAEFTAVELFEVVSTAMSAVTGCAQDSDR